MWSKEPRDLRIIDVEFNGLLVKVTHLGAKNDKGIHFFRVIREFVRK